MRTLKRGWLVGLALAAGVACGGGSGPSPRSLSGKWKATTAEVVSTSNSSRKTDLVANGGTVLLVLDQGGSFALTVSVPGDPVQQSGGTWSSSVDVLTLTYTSGPNSGNSEFEMNLSGDTLTLNGADLDFDFEDDGVFEAAKLNLRLARQP